MKSNCIEVYKFGLTEDCLYYLLVNLVFACMTVIPIITILFLYSVTPQNSLTMIINTLLIILFKEL